MRPTFNLGNIFLTAIVAVGCSQPGTLANPYDNSATWAALNQSQAAGDFYNGMRQRLKELGFVCTSQSDALNRCVKKAIQADCTYSETIEFNSSGVSRYNLDKNCAA